LSCPHQHNPTLQWYAVQGQIHTFSLKLNEHNFHGISLSITKSSKHPFRHWNLFDLKILKEQNSVQIKKWKTGLSVSVSVETENAPISDIQIMQTENFCKIILWVNQSEGCNYIINHLYIWIYIQHNNQLFLWNVDRYKTEPNQSCNSKTSSFTCIHLSQNPQTECQKTRFFFQKLKKFRNSKQEAAGFRNWNWNCSKHLIQYFGQYTYK
jgi:hypothetical protein